MNKNQDWRLTKVSSRDVLRMFAVSIRKWRGYFTVGVLGIILASTGEVIYPVFYKKFFDFLTVTSIATPGALQVLVGFLVTVLAIRGLVWVCWRTATYTTMHYQAFAMAEIKDNAFKYLARHSYTFFANSFVGSLVQKVNKASRAFETLTDSFSWNFLPIVVQIVGYTTVLFFENPFFAIVVLVWAFIFIGFNYFFAVWKMKYDIERAEADSHTTGVLADALTNHASIDLFARHADEQKNFERVTDKQARITRHSWLLSWVVEAVQSALIIGLEFLVFYFGAKMWADGTISVGMLVLVQSYVISLSRSLWDFGKVVRKFYEAFADGTELVQITKTEHEIVDEPSAKPLLSETASVEFRSVDFAYGNGIPVLSDFNLAIPNGQRVALVGTSGAGKSTVVALLLRFHDVTGGTLLVGGEDVRMVTQDSLHRFIGMVPQDTVLFHRTLRENIRYGRPGASDEEVLAAARAAHCDEFISRLPEGYDTYVGERGVKLSGGERQRVAIARAFLKNAPVLILDEATSSLDSHSESLIQDALSRVMEGRTSIVIAHRLSTIRNMDRIVVLEKGKIVEDGSHDELLANPDSRYKKLWDLQAGGFIGDEAETNEIQEENSGILDEAKDDDLSDDD